MSIVTLVLSGAPLWGCAAQHSDAPPPAALQAEQSILTSSKPVAGSTVGAPVEELNLHFSPPARLDEILVSGPGGDMPAMVHAVREVADYSIPLSGIGPGTYTVSWRASALGREYRGGFRFTVK